MGGDSYCSSLPSTEDVSLPSLSSQDFPHESNNTSVSSGDEECLSDKLENDSPIDGVRVSDSGKFPGVGRPKTAIDEAAEKQRLKVYAEVLRSYEVLQPRIDRLEEAKSKILSYTPGLWSDKVACMDLIEYDVPNATLLLIGPKGSGKSSLVNKISRVFEDDMFLPARAQVSCSSSPVNGTYFLHEYMIPRGSGSFCLYDSRSLSAVSSDNLKMIKGWMTKGVCDGELIRRKSDNKTLKAQLKCKARRSNFFGQVRLVDFVIFVVNGLSVLESMNSTDETKKQYSQMIATNFNNPFLSFKDDKPAIVVTHGDLLLLSDRVKVSAYLGELLGVPPTGQIFDIPEDTNPTTTLAIFDLLIYCLDRADRNRKLPPKDRSWNKLHAVANLLFWMAAAIVIMVVVVFGIPGLHRSKPPVKIAGFHCGQPQAPPIKIPDLHPSQPQAPPPTPQVETLDLGSERRPPTPPVETLHLESQPRASPAPQVNKPKPCATPTPPEETLHFRSQPRAPAAPPEKKPKRQRSQPKAPADTPIKVDWHKIRHIWSD